MRPILIYGSGEFGHVVRQLAKECGYTFLGFIDDLNRGEDILGSWDTVRQTYDPYSVVIAMAIGYRHLEARLALYRRCETAGYKFPRLIHPKAYVANVELVGAGSMVMVGAIIDLKVEIGSLNVVWPGAVINHDSSIAANCFISPNATICGACVVGDSVFVGAGAVIVDHSSVPSTEFIKAGTVYSRKLA